MNLSVLGYIILFTLIGSVFSLIGGVFLLLREKQTLKYSHFLAAFAAGTLLGTVFFDLFPEAIEEAEHVAEKGLPESNVFLWTLIGILGFSVHNFIDGVVIAATFLVSIPLGVVTTIAVAAHEIPQEIGDFGILLHKGLRRKKVLAVNIFSALTAVVGAVITFLIGERIVASIPILLSLTAGFFIYIAASDLIPEIHHENRRGFAFIETLLLFGGVITVWILINLLEGFGG